MRMAKEITVPSEWVAETLRRDMRVSPHVVGHGIEWDEWAHHNEPRGDYVLWNKNRAGDVCDPMPIFELANRFVNGHFVTTFAPKLGLPGNLNVTGLIPHDQMKKLVQSCLVYLATTKETFGIGILEAMASGVPVLGYAHGGIKDLVQHGVNGYLAEPGDLDDLCDGLVYCLKHRDTLGANGREMAQTFTWQDAAKKVAAVYEKALIELPPTVSIIIPSYEYADKVGRAIESAINQTYALVTDVIVVDDGSDDSGATANVVSEWSERDNRVRYVRQNNSGVAIARNRGIEEVASKYVCCLDADDKLDPRFVEACVQDLEVDRSLGIAYTGLWYIQPDGTEGLSQWPADYDFNGQIRGQNQIPTCCVFRREMWARLGGYRQRYAPEGAGEEDAEFWLRAGAAGWGAKKATDEGLFIYSWQSGRVSGSTNHAISDWRGWHPWTKNGAHPFASMATPQRFSHPVRQYDEPVVSVVIPVGPGHEKEVINALDSLEAQIFRQWEVIVVDDTGHDLAHKLAKAYPYVRWVQLEGGNGAGEARNEGARFARASFLLFLDADDALYPEAIKTMLEVWERQGPAAIYTDYVGKAIVNDLKMLAPNLQRRVHAYNERTHEAIIGHRAFDYDCERAQRQPEGDTPYIWCNITTLVPRVWHNEIGGFDETMASWEDVDYWYRMARTGKCFVRIPEELLVYQFHTGGRREEGRAIHTELIEYMKEKYRGKEMAPCRSCGGGRNQPRPTPMAAAMAASPVMARSGASAVTQDSDWILCDYAHPNRGHHMVYGGSEFNYPIEGVKMMKRGGKYKINYGYRGGGARFLVHRLDLRVASHLFLPVGKASIAPKAQKQPLQAPKTVAPATPTAQNIAPAPPPPPPKPVVESVQGNVQEVVQEVIQGPAQPFDLQSLPGISASLAQQLIANNIRSAEDVLAQGEDGLMKYRGIGLKRAEMILGALRNKEVRFASA